MSSVDVVIPCYGYGRYLRQSVESVLSQVGPDVRVLVVDDASHDDTWEVACELTRQDPRVQARRHSRNHGHIATYNEGLDWASGTYVMVLSADDYLLPHALDRVVRLLDRNLDVGFAFGNAVECDESGAERQVEVCVDGGLPRVMAGAEFIRASHAVNIVPTPTAIVRTDVQKAVGGYREDLPHAADMEMWWRIAARAAVGFISDYQAVYRRHSNNMSISYLSRRLPDLQQRKKVLDLFFENACSKTGWAARLRRPIYRELASHAVSHSSAAFNEERLPLSQELSDFALDTWPGIVASWPWMKLTLKRRIGIRAWRALQPLLRTTSGN